MSNLSEPFKAGDVITVEMYEGEKTGNTEYMNNRVTACSDGLLEFIDANGKRSVVNMRGLTFVRASLQKG